MQWLPLVVVGGGVVLLLVAAAGLFVLPDALSRQHAATKSVTLALAFVLLGVALEAREIGFWVRIVAIVAVLLATLPVAAHMLARAAARHAYTPEELDEAQRVKDED